MSFVPGIETHNFIFLSPCHSGRGRPWVRIRASLIVGWIMPPPPSQKKGALLLSSGCTNTRKSRTYGLGAGLVPSHLLKYRTCNFFFFENNLSLLAFRRPFTSCTWGSLPFNVHYIDMNFWDAPDVLNWLGICPCPVTEWFGIDENDRLARIECWDGRYTGRSRTPTKQKLWLDC